jgi:hypothetical protein
LNALPPPSSDAPDLGGSMHTRSFFGTLSLVAGLLGAACGDDSPDTNTATGPASTTTEGCYFSDRTCQASDGIAAACGVLGGTAKACPTEAVDATCVYTEEGHATTIYYYKATDGAAWSDDFGTAADDCEAYDGKFTDK